MHLNINLDILDQCFEIVSQIYLRSEQYLISSFINKGMNEVIELDSHIWTEQPFSTLIIDDLFFVYQKSIFRCNLFSYSILALKSKSSLMICTVVNYISNSLQDQLHPLFLSCLENAFSIYSSWVFCFIF